MYVLYVEESHIYLHIKNKNGEFYQIQPKHDILSLASYITPRFHHYLVEKFCKKRPFSTRAKGFTIDRKLVHDEKINPPQPGGAGGRLRRIVPPENGAAPHGGGVHAGNGKTSPTNSRQLVLEPSCHGCNKLPDLR